MRSWNTRITYAWWNMDIHEPFKREIFVYKPWRSKGFLQFEIIINCFARSLCFICIPMLWVYCHYQNVIFFWPYFGGKIWVWLWRLKIRRQIMTFNPLTAKLFNLNFHPLEVVSRWRDPQLQMSENYSDLTKWRSTLFKSCWLMSLFIFHLFKKWDLMC